MFMRIIYDSGSLPHTIFAARELISCVCIIRIIFFYVLFHLFFPVTDHRKLCLVTKLLQHSDFFF